tara:strand:+ start:168 stop:809 length:642 start_codon:yes stop_codon:yes gene_type:complete
MYIYIFLFLLLIITIYFFVNKKKENKEYFKSNSICTDNLTDKEYLLHMIPHHQVAIDISKELQKKSKNSNMQFILKKLIWTQNYEIEIMNRILKQVGSNVSDITNNTHYQYTKFDFISPNKLGLTNTYCDPLFFDSKKHSKHLEHMDVDDNMYIDHMIPHHQVAVDMSKILLKNTKSDFMIYLAYRIIRSQQEEIILLNDLKNNIYNNNSELL